VKALFDTNILIDYLAGHKPADRELKRFDQGFISVVTWFEVLVGAQSGDEEAVVRRFLDGFRCVSVTREVAARAVELRRRRRLRLPDAIIWATAGECDCLLVTRNTRDFPTSDPGIRVPYRL